MIIAILSLAAIFGTVLQAAAQVELEQTAETSTYDLPKQPQTVADIDDPWLRPSGIAEWTGDLDGMIERGFVRLLTPANRTHYFVDGARERGIAAETASALEAMLNEKLGKMDVVRIVCIPARRDQLLPMLRAGFGDIAIGNLAITPEREKQVDFTTPLLSNVRELVVRPPGTEPVNSISDLSGLEIWVRRSSSYFEHLQTINNTLIAEGRKPIEIREANEILEDEDLLEMVHAGLYPATVVDSHKLDWAWARVFPELIISEVAIHDKGQIGAAYRKDSPQLGALLSAFYKRHGKGTSLGNTILDRYGRKSRWLGNATMTEDQRRFDAVVELFRKYSEQYGFDYLKMIAQGYQESRLDSDARSPVGAVGIMQLMPETAAGLPIFMENVDAAEPNIHAGIKYMRYLVDKFFSSPEIDEVNRTLIAFAAYNAGPNRVARLRKLAPDYGLDPNRWFKNVERVIASKVGREPVRYVGNIYKYYLGYRRLREIERQRDTDG